MVNDFSDGAPPLPPPGGYRGSSRIARSEGAARSDAPGGAPAAVLETATLERPRRRPHWLGWVSLGVAVCFALGLTGLVLAGRGDLVLTVSALAAQVLVVAAIVAAIATPRARRLGVIALGIALLGNVATIGGAAALRAPDAAALAAGQTPQEQHWAEYPGVEDFSAEEILAQPSLESERAATDALFSDIRDALTDEFGYTWTQVADENLRPERNGHGGESMLVDAQFGAWSTNEPIQDLTRKREVYSVIDGVLAEHGMPGLLPLNEADGTIPEASLENMYGSADPSQQAVWEWATWSWGTPSQYYAVITDLSRDENGSFRAAAEAQRSDPEDPLEGLTLQSRSRPLLSEADVEEFTERMSEY